MTSATTAAAGSKDSLTVALGEYDTGWHDPLESLRKVRELAAGARSAGAELLVLPEMCTTGFTMDAARYSEREDGPSIRALGEIAAEHSLWLVAGVSVRRGEQFLNSAIAFAPDGSRAGTYDKQRLFGYATEHEIYSAGVGPCVIRIGPLSVGLFVCFDLRFPELFREVGPRVDVIVLVANWPAERQRHWDILTQARAIENQCYFVGVNRTGDADGLRYSGGSVIFDPWGERVDKPAKGSSLRVGEVSHGNVARVRTSFPLAPAAND
jgi:predicted amidohydrolase